MGAESARREQRNRAKHIEYGIDRILNRLSEKHTPLWLLAELYDLRRKSQHTIADLEQIMIDHGDG